KAAPQRPMNLVDEVPMLPNEEEEPQSFQSVLDAAMGLVKETNTLQNKAQNEAIRFELGLADNTHDLMIAEQKASIALQYTKAVRDRFIEAYQQLMQMQI
ncbi:MAG: flagellar hook-basal body complex protein FliE, partial [Lachnospiraceae bacterium]|nr:flagellar hook-basal body complex protein FliE [Lachnospiraceae bacterium]